MTVLGDAIRDALEEHHWTQTDLSEILGRPMQHVNGLVLGTRGLTAQSAWELSQAFGNDPMDWQRLSIQDRLANAKPVDREGIRRRRDALEERLHGSPFKSSVQETAQRIEGLARQIGAATSRDVIEELATTLRQQVAALPKRPWRRRKVA